MTRVALSPPPLGMLMSMRTMSGRCWATRSSTSSPSWASPTTSMSGSSDKILTSPCRSSGWSSAMTMRIDILVPRPLLRRAPRAALPLPGAFGHPHAGPRHVHPHLGAPARGAHQPKLSLQEADPLPHVQQPKARLARQLRGRFRIEPRPVVLHHHADAAGPKLRPHRHPAGLAVALGVVDGFLRDPEQGGLGHGRQALLLAQHLQLHLQPRLLLEGF